MLNFVDSYYKQFSVQISQFVDTFRVFPAIAVNTGNFDIASQSFWLDYGEKFIGSIKTEKKVCAFIKTTQSDN